MKRISLLLIVIIFSLGVNAQELRDFIGEYSILENMEKNTEGIISHRDTIGIRLSDLKEMAKDTSNVKVKQTQGLGIKYSDLVSNVPTKKDAKMVLEENKLVLTQNKERKEYVFKTIKKENNYFLIETTKGDNIVINNAKNVLHVKINEDLFVLKN